MTTAKAASGTWVSLTDFRSRIFAPAGTAPESDHTHAACLETVGPLPTTTRFTGASNWVGAVPQICQIASVNSSAVSRFGRGPR